jgi:hypothetical protein
MTIAWLVLGALIAGTTPDTTLTLATPSDGVIRVTLRSALAGRDTGMTVVVKNSSDADRLVVIRCESLHGVPIADSLKAQPETLFVPARSAAATRISFQATLAALSPGVYPGAIVATAGAATVRRQLLVTVDRLPPLLLIGTTWTVRVVRKVPFSPWFDVGRSALLPVPADADTGLLGSGDSVGTALAGPMGAVAYAYHHGSIERLAPGVLGVPLAFDDLTIAGDYTGPLTLIPGSPDSKLALTVRVTDYWFWPALAILVGIVLAFALQRYTTVDRAYLQLKADVLRVASQWGGAQQQYTRALSPAVGSAADIEYDIGPDFLQQCDSLLRDVDALKRPLIVPLDGTNVAYASAQQRLTTLRGVLTDWPQFAKEIDALAAKLVEAHAEAGDLRTPPPANAATVPSTSPPDVLEAALRRLRGGPITVPDLESTRSAVRDMTAFLGEWTNCAERVVADRKRLANVQPHVNSATQQAFSQADGDIAKARSQLQSAQSAADLTRLDTLKTIDNAEGSLSVLEAALLTAPAPHPKHRIDRRAAVASLALSDLGVETGAIDKPENQLKRLLKKLDLYDYLFFLLTLLIAVLTGFKTLYLGQNSFGTPADYIAAVLWGFGTKYTLETLTTVIGHFFQRA